MFEVSLGGGSPADRPGTRRVPDLGQVPELDAGVVALGLVPVVAVAGGDRVERDEQISLSAGPGAQPPGAVSARRAVLAGSREGEPRLCSVAGPAGRIRSTRRVGFARFRPDVERGSSVRVGHSRARWRAPARRSRSRTRSSWGSGRRRRARSRASAGSMGPMPGISPGRSARSSRVASGMVRLTRPTNPAGTAPVRGRRPGPGRRPGLRDPEPPSGPASSCRRRRPGGAGVFVQQQVQVGAGPQLVHDRHPGRPFLSSRAHAVIRWSAASTSAGGSSRPISAALPESSAHRCTRASRAACSRRLRALSGATSITARAIAARSPPGVSRPARPSTSASAARASAGSSTVAARAMISTLDSRRVPSRNAARVPGSLTSRSLARSSSPSAVPRDSASTEASSVTVNSSHPAGIRAGPSGAQPGSGRRRMNSATAACLRALACASIRSQAAIAPATSSSRAPSYRSSSPAASTANPASALHPGMVSSSIPAANPAARLRYSPEPAGPIRAGPGRAAPGGSAARRAGPAGRRGRTRRPPPR